MSFSEKERAQRNTHFQAFCSHRRKFAKQWWRTLKKGKQSPRGRNRLLQEHCRQQLLIHACWICPGGLPCRRTWRVLTAADWRSPDPSQGGKVGLLTRLPPDSHPHPCSWKKGPVLSLQLGLRVPTMQCSRDCVLSWRRVRS